MTDNRSLMSRAWRRANHAHWDNTALLVTLILANVLTWRQALLALLLGMVMDAAAGLWRLIIRGELE